MLLAPSAAGRTSHSFPIASVVPPLAFRCPPSTPRSAPPPPPFRSVPKDFSRVLRYYAGKGYRVIGCADRTLRMGKEEATALPREEVEKPGSLRFLGLVVLENKLKPQSAGVIDQLQRAEINCVMVTARWEFRESGHAERTLRADTRRDHALASHSRFLLRACRGTTRTRR